MRRGDVGECLSRGELSGRLDGSRDESRRQGKARRHRIDIDSRRNASPNQATAEQIASPGHTAARRADRAGEPGCGLIEGQVFPVAKDDDRAVAFGQAQDFLLDGKASQRLVARSGHDAEPDSLVLFLASSGGLDPRPGRDAGGDAVEPVPDRVAIADRSKSLDQHQERGLEGVLGVVRVIQHVPADPHDHRAVPRDERLERGFGVLEARPADPGEQLAIGEAGDRPHLKQGRQVALKPLGRTTGHALNP